MWSYLTHTITDPWKPKLRIIFFRKIDIESSLLKNEWNAHKWLKIFICPFTHCFSDLTKDYTFNVLKFIWKLMQKKYILFYVLQEVCFHWLPIQDFYDPRTIAEIFNRLHHLNNAFYQRTVHFNKVWLPKLSKKRTWFNFALWLFIIFTT